MQLNIKKDGVRAGVSFVKVLMWSIQSPLWALCILRYNFYISLSLVSQVHIKRTCLVSIATHRRNFSSTVTGGLQNQFLSMSHLTHLEHNLHVFSFLAFFFKQP